MGRKAGGKEEWFVTNSYLCARYNPYFTEKCARYNPYFTEK